MVAIDVKTDKPASQAPGFSPFFTSISDVMLRAKIDDLFARGCWFEARYFESLSKHFCRALESAITAVRAARQALLRPGGRSGGGDRGRRASLFSTASVLFNQSSVEPVGDDGGDDGGMPADLLAAAEAAGAY